MSRTPASCKLNVPAAIMACARAHCAPSTIPVAVAGEDRPERVECTVRTRADTQPRERSRGSRGRPASAAPASGSAMHRSANCRAHPAAAWHRALCAGLSQGPTCDCGGESGAQGTRLTRACIVSQHHHSPWTETSWLPPGCAASGRQSSPPPAGWGGMRGVSPGLCLTTATADSGTRRHDGLQCSGAAGDVDEVGEPLVAGDKALHKRPTRRRLLCGGGPGHRGECDGVSAKAGVWSMLPRVRAAECGPAWRRGSRQGTRSRASGSC